MTNGVHQWAQQGRLAIWRYANPVRDWRGWHLAADPAGSRSVRNLLDRMHAGEACYRTLSLEPVTDLILSVPNHGGRSEGRFEKLRIAYVPGLEDLRIAPDGGALVMTIGERRLRKASAAFAEVEAGGGDFQIPTSDDKKAEPWMFWWMLNENQDGKRS